MVEFLGLTGRDGLPERVLARLAVALAATARRELVDERRLVPVVVVDGTAALQRLLEGDGRLDVLAHVAEQLLDVRFHFGRDVVLLAVHHHRAGHRQPDADQHDDRVL